MTAIETTELTKRYENTLAIDDLNLSIPESIVYGFLDEPPFGWTHPLHERSGSCKLR